MRAWYRGRATCRRFGRWPRCSSCGRTSNGEDWGSSQSALKLRDAYADWDAEQRFSLPGIRVTDPKAAQCGEVLKGVLKPRQCKLFGKECTPEHPVGALMVSSEGACAAYYNFALRKTASVEA
jgi:hydrogenase expression/formation protein HypD